MWLIPISTLTFYSSHEADEIIISIREKTAPWFSVGFLAGEKKPYFSEFIGHKFTLKENFILFPLIFSGGVEYIDTISRVKVFIRPGWFLALWFVLASVFFVWDAYQYYVYYYFPINDLPPKILFLIGPAIYLLGLGVFQIKILKHQKVLSKIFKADLIK